MRKELLLHSLAPRTVDAATKTLEVAFYTGSTVERFNFWTGEEWLLRLSLDPEHVNLNSLKTGRAPFLDAHNPWSVRYQLGVVETAWLDSDKGGLARIRFSEQDGAEGIFRDIQNGVLRNVSVGTRIDKMEDISKKGDKVKTMLAVDWTPEEISLVPVGADPDAQVLSAHSLSYGILADLRNLAGASSEKTAALESRVAELEARLKLATALMGGKVKQHA